MIVQALKRQVQILIGGAVLVLTPIASSSAQESVAEMVINGCKAELVEYCSTVTPGRGRLAACLLAHNDKLSEQCEDAFEVGLVQLSMILSTINYVVEQCGSDIDEYCEEGAIIGGGKIQQCLSKNRDKLEQQCQTAFSYAEESLQ